MAFKKPILPNCCLFPNHTVTGLYHLDNERNAVIERSSHANHALRLSAVCGQCTNVGVKRDKYNRRQNAISPFGLVLTVI